MMDFEAHMGDYRAQTEQALEALCDVYFAPNSEVARAARYSLLGGGKRVRGILVLAACALLGGDVAAAAPLAAGIEMLHCYSLIHDDLPCMDNDDMRRGKPSCHKAFGEATALLAGDALLTAAFEAVSDAALPAEARISAVKALSFAAGARGMVLGQELDLRIEQGPASEEELRAVHQGKTGALINAAVQMGAAAAGAAEADRARLRAYAEDLGLVFQIVDDVLDVTSTSEALGKPVGSDAANGKTTFATLYGPARAMAMAAELTESACAALAGQYGPKAEFLCALARSLLRRDH